jgi:hypothetical protein
MDNALQVRRAIEKLGYIPTDGASSKASRDCWFQLDASTENAKHVLFLQYKPSWKAYSVHAGVYNAQANALFNKHFPFFSLFLPRADVNFQRFVASPCRQLFDVGRFLDWPLLIIPDPGKQELWPFEIERVFRDFLLPFLFPVKNAAEIQQILFRDDVPFGWKMSQSVLRAAEIFCLAKVAGIKPETCIEKIMLHADLLRRDSNGYLDVGDILAEMCHTIYDIED